MISLLKDTQQPLVTTVLFTFAMGFAALHPSGFKANYMDVTLYNSGVTSGLGNTIGSVASFGGPYLVAWILKQYASWSLIFLSVAGTNLVAAALFGLFSTAEPIDKEAAGKKED